MSTNIKIRRSAVPGRVPTTEQLNLGEIAINTADGKIYFKKYDAVSNTESIIDASSNLDPDAILDLLSGIDGANSGLDADLLDGQHGSYYLDYNNFVNVPPATLDLTLSGKVTGTAFSNTGVMTLITELANTGVTPGTYGSPSLVPVVTIDEDGRITSANTVSVAGVANTSWDSSNNTFTIETADGGSYSTLIDTFADLDVNGLLTSLNVTVDNRLEVNGEAVLYDQLEVYANNTVYGGSTIYGNESVLGNLRVYGNIAVDGTVDGRDIASDGAVLDSLSAATTTVNLTGKVTGSSVSNNGVIDITTELSNTGVVANTYGSASQVPIITVDEDGRITAANTVSVAGVSNTYWDSSNNTFTVETADGGVFDTVIEEFTDLTIKGGTGKITFDSLIAPEITNGDNSVRIIMFGPGYTPNTSQLYVEANSAWFYSDLLVQRDLTANNIIAGNDLTANNIIVSGLIDGRDVAADGSKLDGIETGATADQSNTEIFNAVLSLDGANSGLDADLLDGQQGTYYLDYGNFSNTSALLTDILSIDGPGSNLNADLLDGYNASDILAEAANTANSLVGNGRVTINGGNAIDVSAINYFDLNDANNTTITVNHADTSSIGNISLTLPNVVTSLTFDTYGHVQTVGSTDLDTRYYTETELNNGQLDNRYYTETEADNKFVDATGDTMSGALTVNADINQQYSSFVSASSTLTTLAYTSIYSFPYANISGGELVVSAKRGVDTQITKLLITHNGSTVVATEFGTVYTGSSLAEYEVAFSGANIQLLARPTASTSTAFNIAATLIKS